MIQEKLKDSMFREHQKKKKKNHIREREIPFPANEIKTYGYSTYTQMTQRNANGILTHNSRVPDNLMQTAS